MSFPQWTGGPTGPIRDPRPDIDPRDLMRGHPTAPGQRDAGRLTVGRQDALDGQPGIPRVTPTPTSHGPGIPGPTPSGPTQPGVLYDGREDA